MIVPDHEIRRRALAGTLIAPFREEQLNPASYDVTLGDTIMIESASSQDLVRFSISGYSKEEPFKLKPGQFILASTMERMITPDDLSCQFLLKSSRAREGLNHLLAGWIDPGFGQNDEGGCNLTLELHNVRQLQPIDLWPGMKIGQLVWHTMVQPPERNYQITGRYNVNHQTVVASRG